MEGQRITEVVADPTPRAIDGATVIDGAGGTLMPGLVESHAHIGLADLPSADLTRLPVEEHMLITVRNARTRPWRWPAPAGCAWPRIAGAPSRC